jgi:hypothetical protein
MREAREGESRRYEWSSTTATDFNIHYHEGPEVFYHERKTT